MHTDHIHDIYRDIRQRIMSSGDDHVFWNDTDNGLPISFVGVVQIFSDKTANTLKSSAMVAYSIHNVLLNSSPDRREWLTNNGYTIFCFLPAPFHDFYVA